LLSQNKYIIVILSTAVIVNNCSFQFWQRNPPSRMHKTAKSATGLGFDKSNGPLRKLL